MPSSSRWSRTRPASHQRGGRVALCGRHSARHGRSQCRRARGEADRVPYRHQYGRHHHGPWRHLRRPRIRLHAVAASSGETGKGAPYSTSSRFSAMPMTRNRRTVAQSTIWEAQAARQNRPVKSLVQLHDYRSVLPLPSASRMNKSDGPSTLPGSVSLVCRRRLNHWERLMPSASHGRVAASVPDLAFGNKVLVRRRLSRYHR